DDLADTGDQRLVGADQVAAEHDDGRVEQGDRGGDDLADAAARLPQQGDGRGVAGAGEGGQAGQVVGRGACEKGGAAGDRLDAVDVAAPAGRLPFGRDGHVPDLPGGAERPALQPAARDDARADARRDLHEQQVVDARV